MTDVPDPSGDDDDGPLAPCRYCGEQVRAAAKKCRFCGEWLDERMREAVRARGRGEGDAVDVPVVMKVWGGLGMGLVGIMGVLQLVQIFGMMAFMAGRRGGGPMAPMLFGMGIGFLISLAILAVFFRLGLGLWRGERTSVIGMGILGGLGLVGCVFLLIDDPMAGAIALGFVLLMYAPPVAAGAAAWSRLR